MPQLLRCYIYNNTAQQPIYAVTKEHPQHSSKHRFSGENNSNLYTTKLRQKEFRKLILTPL